MVNQTRIPTERGYPTRQGLPEFATHWDQEIYYYKPDIWPEFETVAERLADQGVEVATKQDLMALAKLSTAQAVEIYGPKIAEIRHPLGRTGINGTGVYWKAGRSVVADMAILRDHPEHGMQLAMVFNRGKWKLPGGFEEVEDQGDRRRTAVREAQEETSIPLESLAEEKLITTLVAEHVKPRSSRSADLSYLTTQVEIVLLPDPELGDELKHGDDAEDGQWFSHAEVILRGTKGQISPDHFDFAQKAFGYAEAKIPTD